MSKKLKLPKSLEITPLAHDIELRVVDFDPNCDSAPIISLKFGDEVEGSYCISKREAMLVAAWFKKLAEAL